MVCPFNRSFTSFLVWCILFCTLLVARPLNAQQLKFQHIGVEQGLSQDIVTSIVQDSLGFMWFGTENGLNRYDGYSVTVYKPIPRDSNSLSRAVINHLQVDSKGRLLIVTIGDGHILEQGAKSFTPLGLARWDAALCEGEEGSLWISTGEGLYNRTHDGTTSMVLAKRDGWQAANVMSFDRGTKLLFVGSATGLAVFSTNNGQPTQVRTNATASLDGIRVSAICRSRSGDVFVGTVESGLFRLSSDLQRVRRYIPRKGDPHSLSEYRIHALAEDHDQQLWVGTFSTLEKFDPTTERFVHHVSDGRSDGLRGDRIYSLCVDRTGVLWAGTYRGGVNRLDRFRQRFPHVAYEPDRSGALRASNVFSLLESHDGDLWVGTDNGLFQRRNGGAQFIRYMHDLRNPRSLSGNAVLSMFQRRNGELWFGDADGVANRYHPTHNGFDRFPLPDPGVGKAIRTIYETRDGRLLIGTESRGVYVLDSLQQTFVVWNVPGQALNDFGVWSAHEDRHGHLWLGTFYASYILRVAPGKRELVKIGSHMDDESGLTNPFIRAFTENSNGVLHLGTWGNGFARYDRSSDRYTWYTENDGLSSNYVKAMQADDRGRLWIATEKGLTRFDPESKSFRTYTTEDGLQSNFFWSGSTCKGKDGKIYFGGTNGFNVFHPDSILENTNAPPVIITEIRVLDQPAQLPAIGPDRVLHLAYDENFFSFEFVALDYTFPARNQYAYMLEGLDKDWVHSGTRRYAAYTHLDPGSYVFRVRGANNDGVWNDTGTALAIVIAPPYWMTWWFRGFVVLLIAGGLYGFYRYRLSQILKVERLRQRIGQDLHDDIGTNLSAIVIASQVIRQQHPAGSDVLKQVDDIGAIALRTQELMRDIVWMLNPRNDTLQEFVGRMRRECALLFRGSGYSFEAPAGEPQAKTTLEFKRNVFLIYKEMLNNTIKHAGATHVQIQISFNDNTLIVRVQDDGVGFDPEKVYEGNGLTNMRNRAERIGAALRIVSDPGKGTAIELEARIT